MIEKLILFIEWTLGFFDFQLPATVLKYKIDNFVIIKLQYTKTIIK